MPNEMHSNLLPSAIRQSYFAVALSLQQLLLSAEGSGAHLTRCSASSC